MSTTDYDIIVVGAGPGGYVAAIRAAQLGMKAAVVEREHLGGICLNWGCIPTKALLRAAEIFRTVGHAAEFGIQIDGKPSFDAPKLVARSRKVSAQLNGGVGFLLKKNKVDVIWGEARFAGPGRLIVEEPEHKPVEPANPRPSAVKEPGTYNAPHVIVATGARPRVLPGLEPDGRLVWTYFEAMKPAAMPKSLLVVGSGAIGVEFASFYNAFGVDVTVVELAPQILPVEDPEIAAFARKRFEARGIKIITSAQVLELRKTDNSVIAKISASGSTTEITAERVVSAVGVVPNTENLELTEVGVKTEKGFIVRDGLGRTTAKGIYAIGDVAGPPLLAHKAEHEGVVCVEAIKGLPVHPLDRARIPGCTYCDPQIASIGLSEPAATAAEREIKVGRFPYRGNGKAIALGETEGLVKTIFDAETGELLGAHLVGAEATELIQGFAIAMQLEATEADLMHTIFPHPTLSETMHESVLDAFGRAIHI